MNEHERVIATDDIEPSGEIDEGGALDGEGAGKEHLPIVARGNDFIERGPRVRGEETRHGGEGLLLDDGLGNDDELGVVARDIEVLDIVAEVITITEDAAARTDGEREREAMLIGVRARVHARFHDALSDGLRVAETCEVPY
jgi:hypothetical protein